MTLSLIYFIVNIYFPWALTLSESSLLFSNIGQIIIFLVILTSIIVSWTAGIFQAKNDKVFHVFVILNLILFLTCFASSFLIFFIFFEIRLWPLIFLILGWGYQPERLKAGLWIAMYTLLASLPLLVLILFLRSNVNMSVIRGAIRRMRNSNWRPLIFLTITAAFFAKFPIFFFHLWLPKAHVEAPVTGSIILAALLLKLAGLGLFFVLPLWVNSFLTSFIFFFILTGGRLVRILCVWQKDAKVLVAYSSVSHMAFAARALIWGASKSSLLARIMIILAHGISSSFMFCIANSIYIRRGTRVFTLQKRVLNNFPLFIFRLFFASIANIAGPPRVNFFAEVFSVLNLMSVSYFSAGVLALIIFLAAAYSLILYLSLCQGSRPWFKARSLNLRSREIILYYTHIFIIFWIFFLF